MKRFNAKNPSLFYLFTNDLENVKRLQGEDCAELSGIREAL
jgi:hypothetical protein